MSTLAQPPPSVTTQPYADTLEAIGEDDSCFDQLPLPKFNFWATSRRTSLAFFGLTERASSDKSPRHRAPLVAFLAQSNGRYQVPSSHTCDRAFVPSLADSHYVLWMNKFLTGVGSSLHIVSTSTWTVYLRPYENKTAKTPPTTIFQLNSWYALSMITGRFIAPDDLECLQADQSAR